MARLETILMPYGTNELARASGVAPSIISRYKNGRRVPLGPRIRELARAIATIKHTTEPDQIDAIIAQITEAIYDHRKTP